MRSSVFAMRVSSVGPAVVSREWRSGVSSMMFSPVSRTLFWMT